jgi:hypothetical protein
MTSGHYCDGCAQAYYKCVCDKQEEKILPKKMNERIDKLLVEAGAYFGGDGVIYDTFDPKKFAELIVQECIWAFGETRTEPSLEKYILDRLGINHE